MEYMMVKAPKSLTAKTWQRIVADSNQDAGLQVDGYVPWSHVGPSRNNNLVARLLLGNQANQVDFDRSAIL